MRKIFKNSIIIFLRLYKLTISNYFYFVLLGGGCKYQRSCSEFAIDAVNEKGVIRGILMSIRRFFSCQPFSKKSLDTIKDF